MATTPYGPNTRSVEKPYQSEVLKADPDYYRDLRVQVQFEFSRGRIFTYDPTKSGPYSGS